MPRPPLFFLPIALLTLSSLSLLAACGGGDDGAEGSVGQLTNPQDAPTASPWDQPPAVFEIDPNAIVPISGGAPTPTPAPPPGEGGEPGVCGPKYTVASGDTFSSIATKCGTTTQGMRDANPGVEPTTIRPGDVLNVPAAAPEASP
jgi:hypothetical protein